MSATKYDGPEIDPSAPPSGKGCAECLHGAGPGWWLHLRRCAACGHVGCCDNSPSQHATAHNHATGHPIIQSFEPGEDWFYDYREDDYTEGPVLAPPHAHPAGQPVPGPAGAVPADWQHHLSTRQHPRRGISRGDAEESTRSFLRASARAFGCRRCTGISGGFRWRHPRCSVPGRSI